MLPRPRPSLPARARRVLRRGAALAAIALPTGAATFAVAQTADPAPAGRSLSAPATQAKITWSPPAGVVEDERFTLGLSGEIDGQATAHAALLDAGTPCPASPLFPRQIATGAPLTVAPDPAAIVATPEPTPLADPTTPTTPSTTPEPAVTPTPLPTPSVLGGLVTSQLGLTAKNSGSYHLCGWVVAAPPSSEASTVARIDHPLAVANRSSPVAAELPDTARSGDFFTVKVTGTSAGSGRRLLVMAEPDKGQQCDTMRKAAAGKRPLQTVTAVPAGSFSKTLKLRYRTKTAGSYLLCLQVVEAADRTPEGSVSRVMAVTESLKCVNTQTAIAQRRKDLDVIRGRRDAARSRLSASRKRLAPIRRRYSAARRASNRRVASARRAVSRAKSSAGKAKARKRLAAVRRTEARRVKRARAPYAKAYASVKVRERTYRQYRTGANLLSDTIGRMKKDTKKYCAGPAS